MQSCNYNVKNTNWCVAHRQKVQNAWLAYFAVGRVGSKTLQGQLSRSDHSDSTFQCRGCAFATYGFIRSLTQQKINVSNETELLLWMTGMRLWRLCRFSRFPVSWMTQYLLTYLVQLLSTLPRFQFHDTVLGECSGIIFLCYFIFHHFLKIKPDMGFYGSVLNWIVTIYILSEAELSDLTSWW